MGTNYYVETNKCECCNRSDRLHIGKASEGWSFMFRSHDDVNSYVLKSWHDWKTFLKDKHIVDEYGHEIAYVHLVTMIEHWKSPEYVNQNGSKNKDHIAYTHNEYLYRDVSPINTKESRWHCPDGYCFTTNTFS